MDLKNFCSDLLKRGYNKKNIIVALLKKGESRKRIKESFDKCTDSYICIVNAELKELEEKQPHQVSFIERAYEIYFLGEQNK